MTAARRLAAILAAGVRHARASGWLACDRANGSFLQGALQDAAGRARAKKACEGDPRALFGPPGLPRR